MTDFSKLPPECDQWCRWRWCLHPGEDKGTFAPGRGYTSYHKTPRPVCMTRHLHGCPAGPLGGRPMPDMDKLIPHLETVVRDAKASKKLKAEIARMLDLIRILPGLVQGRSEP